MTLLSNLDYYALCQAALKQCNDLKDRFAILDVLASDRNTNGIGTEFRGSSGVGSENLKYGAAYYPYLQTVLNYQYTDNSVQILGLSNAEAVGSDTIGELRVGDGNGLVVTFNGPQSETPQVAIETHPSRSSVEVAVEAGVLMIKVPREGDNQKTVQDVLDAAADTDLGQYRLAAAGDTTAAFFSALSATPLTYDTPSSGPVTLGSEVVRTKHTDLYNKIKAALDSMRVILPPSGAVAGVYAKVDRERGVWKAPANVGLASVIGPMEKLSNEDQETLNVDPTGGKSINAIRSFTGKGTLIWGTRTLAGNDNEWRYIPVRRLFNLIEESIQKATAFAVFEPNNAITWLKLKTMIESYLDGLWRQGALAGATPEAAFFVNVGLGKSMTQQDILEGRMMIEVGIAAVRPAEFIILRFSHKLQEA